jgi:hypothetical protein
MNALDRQVAGQHYKNQKIQPIQLAYMLGQTPAFCKVCKYSTRIKDDPVQQLEKALHCIELDEELKEYHIRYNLLNQQEAFYIIDQFTSIEDLRNVLKCMMTRDYNKAKMYMGRMIEQAKKMQRK